MPENESLSTDARDRDPRGDADVTPEEIKTADAFTLHTLVLDIENRPSATWRLDDTQALAELTTKPLVLAGGVHYALSVGFTVGDAIVSGLTYTATAYRDGIQVDVTALELGSYGPQAVDQRLRFPSHGWQETPSGIPSHGTYTVSGVFTDDDGTVLGALEYTFQITED